MELEVLADRVAVTQEQLRRGVAQAAALETPHWTGPARRAFDRAREEAFRNGQSALGRVDELAEALRVLRESVAAASRSGDNGVECTVGIPGT